MKNFYKLLLILLMAMFAMQSWAQVPEKFNYQAVVRNSSGQIYQNQSVNFKISIKNGSPAGATVYQETQTKLTNDFGSLTWR